MALKVTIPCELYDEGNVIVHITADTRTGEMLVELPPEIDVEEHIVLDEMGYDLPDCIGFKISVEKGGIVSIFKKQGRFEPFMEAIYDQGVETLGDEYPVDDEDFAEVLMDFLVQEVAMTNIRSEMDNDVILEIIKDKWPEFFQTRGYLDREMELVSSAYEQEDIDFIKRLDPATNSTLYRLEFGTPKYEKGAGHIKAELLVELHVADEIVEDINVCFEGWFNDLVGLGWDVDECENSMSLSDNAAHLLEVMGENTDFEDYLDLEEPWLPYCNEDKGYFSVFVDGERVMTCWGQEDAEFLFDALRDAKDYKSQGAEIELMAIDPDEWNPEEDDINYDDMYYYYEIRSG
jgi:hypothetical protein